MNIMKYIQLILMVIKELLKQIKTAYTSLVILATMDIQKSQHLL